MKRHAILDSMLRIPAENLSLDKRRRVEEMLTLRLPPSGDYGFGADNGSRDVELFKYDDEDYLIVPRNWPEAKEFIKHRGFEDRRANGEVLNAKFRGTFRAGQQEFAEGTLAALKEDGLGVIAQAACGFGKTAIMTSLIASVGRTTLFLVHKEKLMKQFVTACEQFLNMTPGIIQGDRCDYEGHQICVGMLQSLHRRQYAEAFYRHWGLIAVDECLTGDALVTTDVGEIPIKNIPCSGAKTVLSFDENTQLWEHKRIVRFIPRGVKPVVEVRTAGGILRCTEDHLVGTEDGWAKAGNLLSTHRILSPVNVGAERESLGCEKTVNPASTCSGTRTGGTKSIERHVGRRLRKLPLSAVAIAESASDSRSASSSLAEKLQSGLSSSRATIPLEDGSPGQEWTTSFQPVESVRRLRVVEQVYDIEVEGNHNFVANGLLVHNCHRASAPTFAAAIEKFPAKYRIGLTATPRRGDKLENVFFWNIGDIGVIGHGEFLDCSVYVVDYSPAIHPSSWQWNGKKNLGKLITALARDPARTGMICRLVADATRKGRRSMIVSHRVKHLEEICNRLQRGFQDKGEPYTVGIYASGSTKKIKAQQARAEKCTITLGTYGMIGEGHDIPDKDTMFLATPKADVEQVVGRIRRIYEGKKTPLVVDVSDDIGFLKRFANKRIRFYGDAGTDKSPWTVKLYRPKVAS